MAKIKLAIRFKHQANLGEDIEEVAFEAGEEITILQAWEDAYLIKNEAGLLFNVPKEHIEAD